MYKSNKRYILIFAIFSQLLCIANSFINLPLQYPSTSYTNQLPTNARQVWDITSDHLGIVYYATSEGLFTNTYGLWESHSENTDTKPIFTIAYINDTVWTGKTNEIGYYTRNNKGELIYYSKKQSNLGTPWNITYSTQKIYFQFEYQIAVYDRKSNHWDNIYSPARINNIYQYNHHTYYTLRNGDIGVITNNRLHNIISSPLLINKEVRTAIVQNNHHYYILLEGNIIDYNPKLGTVEPIDYLSDANKIFTAQRLSNDEWILGSITKGLSIATLGQELKTVQTIHRKNGLDDNTVLSIHQDNNNQLWVGQDYGISYIEINTPYRKVFTGATVYDIAYFHNTWYVATNKGLYFSRDGQELKPYPDSEGQVWSITKTKDALLVSHINHPFIINKENKKEDICTLEDVHHLSPINADNTLLIGVSHAKTYLCKKVDNTWMWSELLNSGFANIIEAHHYKLAKGFYLLSEHGDNKYIDISKNGNIKTEIDFRADNIYKLHDDILVVNDNKFYSTTVEKGRINFKENNNYPFTKKNLKNPININSSSYNQDIIVNTPDEILYYNQLKNGTYIEYTKLFGEFGNTLNSKGKHLRIINNQVFLFSGQSLYSYNLNFKNSTKDKKIIVNRINTHENDSVNDYYYPATQNRAKLKLYPNVTFQYGINALKFDDVSFSYKLSTSKKEYSPWTKERKVKFTNLGNGEHTLYIKAKRNNISYDTATVHFVVDGYWYQKTWGKLLLASLLFFITALMVTLRYRHVMHERIEHVKKQHTKDLLKTRNQQSVEFLTRIEQKNIFLEKIKQTLSSMRNEKARELVRLIEAESKKESKDFVYFSFFADNQQDFISAVSSKFPNLTTNDIRLIVFIKLNMSTKDIASITHTSTSSVDKARYRLRKKLDLRNDISLSKYLLNFEKDYAKE